MEQVPEEAKTERLARLQGRIDGQQAAFNRACLGRTIDVLFEKPGRHPGQLTGRSPYLQPVNVMAPTDLVGEIVPVALSEVSANSLKGVVLGPEDRHFYGQFGSDLRPEVPAGA